MFSVQEDFGLGLSLGIALIFGAAPSVWVRTGAKRNMEQHLHGSYSTPLNLNGPKP